MDISMIIILSAQVRVLFYNIYKFVMQHAKLAKIQKQSVSAV